MTDDMKQLHILSSKILEETPDEENCSKEEIEFYAELQNLYEYLNTLEH